MTPVKRFKNSGVAASRIWERIQGLADSVKAEAKPAKGSAGRKAKVGAQAAQDASTKVRATKKATVTKNAPEAKTTAKSSRGAGEKRSAKTLKKPAVAKVTREGSKTETILALMQQPGGATLGALMEATRWQAHSVRGFISAVVAKKMRLAVESTKAGGGERTYSIA